jgi:hypothetical protein
MKQVFLSTVVLSSGWGGEDMAPFQVVNDTNPLAGAFTMRMPTSGTIRNFVVELSTAFGAGTSGTFRWQKGGVTQDLSVTVADSATSGSDLAHELTFVENDELVIDCVRTGATATATMWFSFEVECDEPTESLYGVTGGLDNDAAVEYANVIGGTWLEFGGHDGNRVHLSAAGDFTKYTVRMTHAPGVGQTRTFHLLLNGTVQDGTGGTVDTTLVISGTNTTGTATFTLPVVEHDALALTHTASAGAAAQWGTTVVLLFDAANPTGAQQLAAARSSQLGTSTTEYQYPLGPCGGATAWSTEAARHLVGAQTPLTLTAWTVRVPVAHGTTVVYTVRKNGADTDMTVTFGAADLEQTITGLSIPIGPGDKWSVQGTSSGGVNASAKADWTFVALFQNPQLRITQVPALLVREREGSPDDPPSRGALSRRRTARLRQFGCARLRPPRAAMQARTRRPAAPGRARELCVLGPGRGPVGGRARQAPGLAGRDRLASDR